MVVKDEIRFFGLLTPNDVIQKAHNLVIDCLTPKKTVARDDEISTVIGLMREERQLFLPVLEEYGEYIGTVSYFRLIKELKSLEKPSPMVTIQNIIGTKEQEENKQLFLKELYHNTRNPIQVILSSLRLFKETKSSKEKKALLNAVHSSTAQIESTINKLFAAYFP